MKKQKKQGKINVAIVIVAVLMVAVLGVGIYALVVSGVFGGSGENEDSSCPAGMHRNCGVIDGGEVVCGGCSYYEVDLKPIIYLYPEEETEVSVKLGNPEKLSVSYPKYKEEGWKVLARPGGELVDLETGRELYSLYWEGKGAVSGETDEGFVVRGEDSAGFLEEKLAILGLSEREVEEFIIYWLPKLEANEYNYIRFATDEEIEEYMPLSVLPEPDSVVRVNMLFKGVGEDFRVREQRLETPERDGFVVVEWGGSELK